MRKSFGLCEEQSTGCRRADQLALLIEAKQLMASKGLDVDYGDNSLRPQADRLPYVINAWTSDNAKQKFMQRMTDVRRRLKGLR